MSAEERYVVGVDFGTLSGRAVVVRVSDGAELGTGVHEYSYAVIDDRLPASGVRLPPEWALQVPDDYREVLKTAGLKVEDAQFISAATAGRLPGLLAGQINGVALHPEDVYLAQKEKPGLHVLVDLSKLMPKYFFNAYGAAETLLTKDRAMVRDVTIALIEANRIIYNQKEKVIPIMVEATKKPQEAVIFSYDYLTKNCVWSVNTGFSKERTEWSIENGIENGDIQPDKKPAYEQVVDVKLGDEALKAAGGPMKIRGCGD